MQFSGSDLTSFSARFEQHCNGHNPGLFGAVSFSSTADYRSRNVAPNSLAFGNVVVNTTSGEQTVTLTNNGPSDLDVSGSTITGSDAGQFSVSTDTCTGGPIASGDTCAFGVKFSPTGTLGPRSATLTFFDDLAPSGGGGTGRDIKLTGQAFPAGTPVTKAFLDSEPNDFVGQGQPLGFTSVTPTSATTNDIAFSVTSDDHDLAVEFIGPDGVDLANGTYEGAELAQSQSPGHAGFAASVDGRSCNTSSTGRFIVDQIAFGGAGELVNFSARFEFHCNGGDPALFGAVSYNATAAYRERLVSPNSSAFGSVVIGTTSGAQTVTLTNDGPSALNVSSKTITGTNAGQFSVSSDTCTGAAVASGGSCAFGIEFSPTGSPGPRSATLTFFDDLAPNGGGGTGRDIKLTGQAFPAGTPVTAAFIDTEAGDPIGNGQQFSSTNVTVVDATPTAVQLTATVGGTTFGLKFSSVQTTMPTQPSPLAPGTYENTRPFTAPSGFPSLTVGTDLISCGATSNGRFLLDQICSTPAVRS